MRTGASACLCSLANACSNFWTRRMDKEQDMAKHTPRFLQIVNDARSRVKEVTVDDVKAMMDKGEKFLLVDVREESEFTKDHLPCAVHLGKGVIERDIEQKV